MLRRPERADREDAAVSVVAAVARDGIRRRQGTARLRPPISRIPHGGRACRATAGCRASLQAARRRSPRLGRGRGDAGRRGTARPHRRLARGVGRLPDLRGQQVGRLRQRVLLLAQRRRETGSHVRALRPADRLGLLRGQSAGRDHRRFPGRGRVGSPRRRTPRDRSHGRARAHRNATVGDGGGGRRPLRSDLHRPALLRRHPLLRPDGLLSRVAAARAARGVARPRRGVRRAARAEVGCGGRGRRADRRRGPLRRRPRGVEAQLRGRHGARVRPLPRRPARRRPAGAGLRQQSRPTPGRRWSPP